MRPRNARRALPIRRMATPTRRMNHRQPRREGHRRPIPIEDGAGGPPVQPSKTGPRTHLGTFPFRKGSRKIPLTGVLAMRPRVGFLVVLSAALSAVPAFSDDQQKAEKQIRKL